MKGFIAMSQERKLRINKELFEAAQQSDHVAITKLIKDGAVVDPQYDYALSLVGESENIKLKT